MDLFQVRHKDSVHFPSTEWHTTVAKARKEAIKKKMPIESEIVNLKIVGHEALVEAIQLLMNATEPLDPKVQFVRYLGNAKEVKKLKVIPIRNASSNQRSEAKVIKFEDLPADNSTNIIQMKPSKTGYNFTDAVKQYRWDDAGLILTEILDAGVVVEQNGRAYLAKNMNLNSETIAIFEMGIRLGYRGAIQQGHPKTSNLLPYGKGVGYLSLAKSCEDRWAISVYSDRKLNCLRISINKRYQDVLTHLGISFSSQNTTREHPEIQFLDVLPVLQGINTSIYGEGLENETILDKILKKLTRKKTHAGS
ncbi:hypothetical protein OAL96_00770 [bacterium]|nr:hypothetical protein [bacterium]MDC0432733.1 hypothetical protein [bacterium]